MALLVRDQYNIDKDILINLADEESGDYYASAFEFYEQVEDTDADELTDSQINWLEKIEADLEGKELDRCY